MFVRWKTAELCGQVLPMFVRWKTAELSGQVTYVCKVEDSRAVWTGYLCKVEDRCYLCL